MPYDNRPSFDALRAQIIPKAITEFVDRYCFERKSLVEAIEDVKTDMMLEFDHERDIALDEFQAEAMRKVTDARVSIRLPEIVVK